MTRFDPELSDALPYFREMEPITLWSSRLALQVPYSEFKDTLIRVAQNTKQRYTGFITKNEEGGVTSFTRARYPRRKYGVSSIAECETGMKALTTKFGAIIQPDPTQGIRVVLGLLEGYDTNAATHTIEEARQALPGVQILPAEVLAIRLTDERPSIYTEPVAVIDASTDDLDAIYKLGDSFRQERFTVENFENKSAYVVETRFCTEPD